MNQIDRKPEIRSYAPGRAVVFFRTREEWGGLSNMASGYPIRACGTDFRTAEALYQALRFPHLPEVQRAIIGCASPIDAKRASRARDAETHPDWDRVAAMRWTLRAKLACSAERFGRLLAETGDRPIVEKSFRDQFWGAKPFGAALVGANVLGRLLMELRERAAGMAPEEMRAMPSAGDFGMPGTARLLDRPLGAPDPQETLPLPPAPGQAEAGRACA